MPGMAEESANPPANGRGPLSCHHPIIMRNPTPSQKKERKKADFLSHNTSRPLFSLPPILPAPHHILSPLDPSHPLFHEQRAGLQETATRQNTIT